MKCRYCGALNTEHDHRCARCGRRMYLASAKPPAEPGQSASRLSVAPAMQATPHPGDRVIMPAYSPPRQESLFPSGLSPGDRLRVVELKPGASATPPPSAASRREAMLRASPALSRTVVSREQSQQRLTFPQLPDDYQHSDAGIYCDAPVALPVHRLLAAMLDGSMMLISVGIFLIIFHLAGAKIVLNKGTLPLYGIAAIVTLTLYRLLWCLACTDSIGMRWSGLRLITFDGDEPNRHQRFSRLVTSYVSAMPAGLGLFWGLADEEKLTWHDHMSKTFPTPRGRLMRYPKKS